MSIIFSQWLIIKKYKTDIYGSLYQTNEPLKNIFYISTKPLSY